ncbi:hypothetical protein QAD02_013619 [Eretmocerus hayati]|uniref:Uncharacterized protein n=1 Tax=Eretmocerus hayati TaxID=131215 RepID=A0ACC2P5W0_9HYME|nr:hypothetical protein QAD02_013619 [Eretmocerus hayati]
MSKITIIKDGTPMALDILEGFIHSHHLHEHFPNAAGILYIGQDGGPSILRIEDYWIKLPLSQPIEIHYPYHENDDRGTPLHSFGRAKAKRTSAVLDLVHNVGRGLANSKNRVQKMNHVKIYEKNPFGLETAEHWK